MDDLGGFLQATFMADGFLVDRPWLLPRRRHRHRGNQCFGHPFPRCSGAVIRHYWRRNRFFYQLYQLHGYNHRGFPSPLRPLAQRADSQMVCVGCRGSRALPIPGRSAQRPILGPDSNKYPYHVMRLGLLPHHTPRKISLIDLVEVGAAGLWRSKFIRQQAVHKTAPKAAGLLSES